MSRNQRKLNPEHEARLWNAEVPVGAKVQYRECLDDPYPATSFTTRTQASVLSGHTAVVWLEEKPGCVAIAHCRPIISAYALALCLLFGLTACHDEESRTETTSAVCTVNGERVPC